MAKTRGPFLELIEVDNFKSYKGRLAIGPMKTFTSVVGPNGSGKSNFMDAISFVMGEKTTSLRVKRLSDLIHGASIGQPVARSASVTAVFRMPDDTEKRFTRSVQGSSSDYRINREVVTTQQYLSELEAIGINVKAKNFLVFQGAVESIAMKNPKERTALFEEISGSGALKEDYDRLKSEMLKAEEETNYSYLKKRGVAAERKEARMEKEEAEKYQRLKDELVEKEVEYQLFRLYHNENEIDHYEKEVEKRKREVEKVEKKKEKAEEALKEKKKEHGKLNRELAKIEQEIREMEVEAGKKRPSFIKAKERVDHIKKKLNTAKKSLTEVRTANEAHEKDIAELEKELREVDAQRQQWEEQLADESQSQGRDVQLEDAQVNEYNRLKVEAQKQSARFLQELDSINREQKAEQDKLDNEASIRSDLANTIKQKEHEKAEAAKRVDKLNEHIRTSERALEEQKALHHELQSYVGSSKERIKELNTELETVQQQLGDAKVDKHEDSRRKKKQEIVEKFKRLHPGVYDRLINMCQPIHKRFNVAITKVLGKYMEAIVVDTEKTARMCINYLKEHMLDPETFLPLDYIQTKPLKERLRNIKEPKNVKLLYDVLNYSPPEIKRVILFATNNALVCDTPEDAMKVAYEMDGQNRYDAVALDGTCYHKSGIMSGGSLDLARKAKRWDDKQMSTLKQKKKQQIAMLDKELIRLREKEEEIGPRTETIERSMRTRETQIEDMKERLNNVEDDIFKDFCDQIGMANIRQYEERELRSQQERAKKRLEFENQRNRIINQLEFEKMKDTKNNVLRWERAVCDDEYELERAVQAQNKQSAEIEKDKEEIDRLKSERQNKKSEVDAMDKEIGEARREVGSIAKDIQALQKQVTNAESKLEMKRAERKQILKHCKMEDIQVPMLVGNMEDIAVESSIMDSTSIDTSTHSSQQMYDREDRIKMDYSILKDSLKDLEEDEVKKKGDKLAKAISDQSLQLQKIQAPNMKAIQKLEMAREKLQSTNEEFEAARRRAKKAKQAFARVKMDRYDKFQKCFEHVANEIDSIYKSLARNQSAQAFLGPENPEEPYLDGINYNCVAPGKRFQPMSNLSGGEKTVAALALLFAIHSYQPAPFFVLDEIDAALDNTNIGKVASYIHSKSNALQTIVISLKEEFFSHADSLVGICPDVGECLISRVYLLDLTQFPQHW
ncbi:LOW QUALITY PROTEIN: structural maintenance of chromosomes protein 1A [Nilaparvata lugens]|uniref:LOW QUALITY PROTEIN: structural maintenance of chromosomes protein 1A n=1 Tax=Nilaparvata lugens TaxID=108931 RepID=UPI00193D310A|nr:LOW QUALITY PROTEIN: structural maintenance of chromosomes protein 1A [Nilaparvata lugens]